jgi:hypothetical protein
MNQDTMSAGTDNVLIQNSMSDSLANKVLKASATFWFMVAVAGQWIFAYYVTLYYGSRTLYNGLEGLGDSHLPNGYIPGDWIGNLAIAAHLFLAVIILVGGPLQFIPQIRTQVPVIHRWNGRFYMFAIIVTCLAGLYMVWVRGSVGDLVQYINITINAFLIILFAAIALRHAIARNIASHKQWVLRLFLVVNGVWFFRVELWLWLFFNKGPVGFDPQTFQGPALSIMTFAQFFLPLAILEIYLRTKKHAGTIGRFAMAAGLFALTVAMATGIFSATVGMWLPRL